MAGKSQGSILGFFNRTKRKIDDDSESAGPSPKQASHQPTCVDSGTVTGERNDAGHINTLRPRQNGPHFPDDNFKCIFLNENV